mmetsp:Transcript_14264/g.13835  ORF Transcript_14264/g.13835 Transcript_14264/m.13835 type:complete len:112 (+) Transcript_14264:318-653(+)
MEPQRSSKGFNGTQDSYYEPSRKEVPKRQVSGTTGKVIKGSTIDYDNISQHSKGTSNRQQNSKLMRQMEEEQKRYEPQDQKRIPQRQMPPSGKKPMAANSKPALNPNFGPS